MRRPAWEPLEPIYYRAIAIEDLAARENFLVEACGSDTDALNELRRVITLMTKDSGFLESPRLMSGNLAGRVIDDFELIEECGRGGIGVVYRARQGSLDRIVAVKVLPLLLRANDATAERFRRESMELSRLRHPGITNILAFGEIDGTFYYAMDFVDGPSLREAMDRVWIGAAEPGDPDLGDLRVVARLVAQVADALHFAHQNSVVHRDVKPHNVLIEKDGRPRLIDFGVAKFLDLRGVTLANDVTGTPHYMSPEQANSKLHAVDRRSDVFSLGIVLYELLTRRKPFTGGSNIEIIKSIIDDSVLAPHSVRRDLPAPLETICLHALEKDPADRYQTAKELAEDLDRFLRGEAIRARPPALHDRLRRTLVKRRTLLTALPIGLAMGAGAMMLSRPPKATFKSRVRTLDGTNARLVSRQLASSFGAYSEDVRDHGRGNEWELELPRGVHALELIAEDGTFAQLKVLPERRDRVSDYRVRLLRPVQLGQSEPGWIFVPGGTQTVSDFESPLSVAGRSRHQASYAPFLVDVACLCLGDLRRTWASESPARWPANWDTYKSRLEGDVVGAFDGRPLAGLTGTESQQLAVELGGRLPTQAETVAFVTGGDAWWRRMSDDEMRASIVMERYPEQRTRMGVEASQLFELAEDVRSKPPIGPFGLHHAIGNEAIRTDWMVIDSKGIPEVLSGAVAGFGWSGDLVSFRAVDQVSIVTPLAFEATYNDVGVRRVRALAPELGAAY